MKERMWHSRMWRIPSLKKRLREASKPKKGLAALCALTLAWAVPYFAPGILSSLLHRESITATTTRPELGATTPISFDPRALYGNDVPAFVIPDTGHEIAPLPAKVQDLYDWAYK